MEPKSSSQRMFTKIWKHRGPIMAVIVAMVRDFSRAEDIFEDTMLEIVNSKNAFDEQKDFLPWAKGIARNIVRRYWASLTASPSPEDAEVIEFIADIASKKDEPDQWKTEKAGLRECMQKLSEKYRKLFLLRYGEDIRGDALAGQTGFKVKSIRSVLMRVRNTLRNCINAHIKGTAYTEGNNG
ncbi:sigma-70 family RNA polymerase sigma factor [Planctomycetota bacterium]